MDYSDLAPKVVGKMFKEKDFEPQKIFDSLIKETDIDIETAKRITDNVSIFIIGAGLEFVSPPLIREIVNVELLKLGFEKERLQNTRIGFPYYDLNKMMDSSKVMVFKTKYLEERISKGVIKEFKEVKELIKERQKE